MHQLIREALNITKELGSVTFVGAVAVFLNTKSSRESLDLDFAIANPITDEELIDKGYKILEENRKIKKYTPRGYKVDIYDSRDLNEIPINTIIENSTEFTVNKKGDIVKAMNLETLIVSKFRANRDQDNYDLKVIAQVRSNEINKERLRNLVKNEHELSEIETTMRYYAKN